MPTLNSSEINYIRRNRRGSVAPVSWAERKSVEGPPIYIKGGGGCNLYESGCRLLGCYKNVNVYNISGCMINVVTKPHVTTEIKKVNIQRVGSIEMNTCGEFKEGEINIPDGHYKNIGVDTYNFYLSLNIFHEGAWRRVYVNRKLTIRDDFYVKPSVTDSVLEEIPEEEQTFAMRDIVEIFDSANKIKRAVKNYAKRKRS